MSDFFWPSTIVPLTSRAYSFKRGSNIVSSPVGGGLPIMGLDLTLESVPFRLTFTLSAFEFQMFNVFYDEKINHGASSFKMMLNAGNGIEEHLCNIIPNTMNISLPVDGVWYMDVSLVAQTTSSQIADSCPNLYELYECYGKQTPCVINGYPPILNALPDA